MNARKLCSVVFTAVAGCILLPPVAQASEGTHATKVTFSQPVEIPGQVLPAGTGSKLRATPSAPISSASPAKTAKRSMRRSSRTRANGQDQPGAHSSYLQTRTPPSRKCCCSGSSLARQLDASFGTPRKSRKNSPNTSVKRYSRPLQTAASNPVCNAGVPQWAACPETPPLPHTPKGVVQPCG